MYLSRRLVRARRSVLALCAACLLVLGFASSAVSAEPAQVTVRVEGLTETKLLPTPVTLNGAPLVKDGNAEHACPGNTALAALQIATGGNWSGPWNSKFKQYELFTIEGETHLFEPEASANYFWSFWLNEKESEIGACEAQVNPGDRALFVVSCFGKACPEPAPTPLGINSPSSANVGEPVPVTVKRFSTSGVATEVPGATITGASAPATTDPNGHVTVAFTQPGTAILRVSAPASIRTEATVCVHSGNDGTCGTSAPAAVSTPAAGSVQNLPAPPYGGPYAVVAKTTGVLDAHSYLKRNAPRVLGGIVTAHTGITSVSIELWRWHRGRCYVYDGRQERFLAAPCARSGYFKIPSSSSFFKVSSTSSFSYLLPFALGPGEYLLDIQATDAAGNRTSLARGTSRIRFYVH
jgi:hypothetical protein